jgi:hypothetical protein
MFDILLTCKPDELQKHAELIASTVEKDDVETFIRTLWKRVPELTVEQEKELHKLGRRVLKKFGMHRIKD